MAKPRKTKMADIKQDVEQVVTDVETQTEAAVQKEAYSDWDLLKLKVAELDNIGHMFFVTKIKNEILALIAKIKSP